MEPLRIHVPVGILAISCYLHDKARNLEWDVPFNVAKYDFVGEANVLSVVRWTAPFFIPPAPSPVC